VYLVDTNVISEVRKKSKANKGVRAFFKQAIEDEIQMSYRLSPSENCGAASNQSVTAVMYAKPINWRNGWTRY
jgi:hypothetical protein